MTISIGGILGAGKGLDLRGEEERLQDVGSEDVGHGSQDGLFACYTEGN